MTDEIKKKPANISRRQFLRNAGIVAGGTVISSAFFLSACGEEVEVTKTVTNTTTATTTAPGTTSTVTTTAPGDTTTETITKYICPVCAEEFDTLSALKAHFDQEHQKTYPPSESYLVYDTAKCIFCQSCMAACSMVHEGEVNLSLSRIQITGHVLQPPPNHIVQNVCRQCVNPVCVQVCPTGACHIDTANGNIRVIDQSVCIGCQRCIQSCPETPHMCMWDDGKKKAFKCDLCINSPYGNGSPACIQACPADAIRLVHNIPDQTDDNGYNIDFSKEPAN